MFKKYFYHNLLDICISYLNKISSNFITFHKRPINTSNIIAVNTFLNTLPQHAIVIQGPVIERKDFTFQTIKLYKRNYPNIYIILSTWDNQNNTILSKIKELDVYIIENKKPKFSGVSNINLQIKSSKEGILLAKSLGADYVIKTRTDQRFYEANVDTYFFNLLLTFPLFEINKRQNSRIISISLNSFKDRIYGITDMLNYGNIDDMLNFWSAKLDNRVEVINESKKPECTPDKLAFLRICEVYLVTEFLINIGCKLNWTLEDSFEKITNHFCIIDKESIDLYWYKYNNLEYKWKNYEAINYHFNELNFKDWLCLYNNAKKKYDQI
jgi:hypothetical protein